MKRYLLNAGVALAGLLADPTAANAQHFTPEQLKAAAERSDKVNDQIKAQEDGGPGGTDVKDMVGDIGGALLVVAGLAAGVAGAYGVSKVIHGVHTKLLDKPDDGSAPAAQGPTQGPTQLGPTATDGEPTSPAEAAEAINTGLKLDSPSLYPGSLLNSTGFRDQNGVEQDGISWDLGSVGKFDTRAGKKAYRINLTTSENEHFDQLVISISQLEKPVANNLYFVKAAFQKTNPDGTISVPYLVSLKRLSPGDNLDRDELCRMVENAMVQISRCSKVETPVTSNLLKQVRD